MLFNAFIPDISAQSSDDEAPQEAIQRAISCYFSGASAFGCRSGQDTQETGVYTSCDCTSVSTGRAAAK